MTQRPTSVWTGVDILRLGLTRRQTSILARKDISPRDFDPEGWLSEVTARDVLALILSGTDLDAYITARAAVVLCLDEISLYGLEQETDFYSDVFETEYSSFLASHTEALEVLAHGFSPGGYAALRSAKLSHEEALQVLSEGHPPLAYAFAISKGSSAKEITEAEANNVFVLYAHCRDLATHTEALQAATELHSSTELERYEIARWAGAMHEEVMEASRKLKRASIKGHNSFGIDFSASYFEDYVDGLERHDATHQEIMEAYEHDIGIRSYTTWRSWGYSHDAILTVVSTEGVRPLKCFDRYFDCRLDDERAFLRDRVGPQSPEELLLVLFGPSHLGFSLDNPKVTAAVSAWDDLRGGATRDEELDAYVRARLWSGSLKPSRQCINMFFYFAFRRSGYGHELALSKIARQ